MRSLVAAICCLPMFVSAQETATVRGFGGDASEEGRQIIVLSDGGFAVVGTTGSEGGNTEIYVAKLDESLNCIWSSQYGGGGVDHGWTLVEASNGDLLVGGWTNSFPAQGYDAVVYRIAPDGQVVWSRTYGGTDWDFGYRLIATEGNYFLCGSTYSYGEGGSDGYVIRFNEDGLAVDEWTWGSEKDEWFLDIAPVNFNELILVGSAEEVAGDGGCRALCASFSHSGEFNWSREEYTDGECFQGLSATIDGDRIFFCGDRQTAGLNAPFVSTIDGGGNLVGYYSFVASGSYSFARILPWDGKLIVPAMTTYVGAGQEDASIFLFNEDFSFIGAPTFGGGLSEELYDGVIDANGRITAVGRYESTDNDQDQLVTVQLSGIFNGTYTLDQDLNAGCFAVGLEELVTEPVDPQIPMVLFDASGRVIRSDWKLSEWESLRPWLESGIYFAVPATGGQGRKFLVSGH